MDILLHPSSTETSNGNTVTFNTGNMVLGGMFVNVTAISGTLPVMVVTLQHSPDGVTWYNVGAIAVTRTTNGASVASPAAVALLADYIQVIWTISGTMSPSFTFSVDVVAHHTVT